ncbi:MAG: hypothetical protein KOO65_01990, partial [Desulfobacterales bacterium]|nr:hypothetical protein [Desulfobacterales bacterium]
MNTKIISGTMVSLRTKLLIPTLLTALLAVAAVICISILQYKSFQYQTDKETIHLKQDLHHLIEDMQNESRNLVKLLSNKWVFLDNVISNNIDGLLDELTSFHKSSLHDFIAVYDMEGIIIARGDSPDHFGMSDDLHQYIMKVKAEKESMSLVTLYDNKLLIFELKCLDAGYGPIGFLAAGQYLDKKNVNTFSQLGQLYLEFQYKGVAVVSSKNFELPENIDKNKFQIDFDDQFTQKPSLSAILWKDTAEITSRFWKNLSLVVTALGLISCLVIFFSRRIIVKTVTALDEA